MSTHGLLTRGISRSPVDSGLDCMAHEVTLPTCIYLANWSQLSPGAGMHCHAKWVAHPQQVRSVFVLLCFLFLFNSLAVRGPSGTNFSFLQIVCQNTEYWCWWNPGSLWYFLARRLMILCKKVHHKFHTLFICWCFRPSWPWVIICGDTSFMKTSSPMGNCTMVHCLLTTNFTQSTVNFCRVFAM